MIIRKDDVTFEGIKPETLLGILLVNFIYEEYGLKMTLTSVTDGKHMAGSKHYLGFAFDVRLPKLNPQDVNATMENFMKKLRSRLGIEYDVVLESDHIHVEFDPR